MKIRLLLLCLLFTATAFAQTDSIAFMRKDSIRQAKVAARQKHFDIGGGVQVNGVRDMGVSSGLLFSLKANSQRGRIAGVLNLSYNLNNNFNIRHEMHYKYQNFPESKFYSTARYNFLKINASMLVPFFNRTNKKGFSLAGILGLSYCNGLGSGEYVSFMDKANPPVIDTADLAFVRPSQKFSIDNRNFAYLGLELGLSASYTYERYQFFVDGMVNMFNDVSGEFNQSLTVTSDAYGAGGTKSPRASFTVNAGVRYCLYNPWQTKPPKRRNK